MAKVIKEVSITEVENYKQMGELARGTHLWSSFQLQAEYRGTDKRKTWRFSGHYLPMVYTFPDSWYIKESNKELWLYRYSAGQDEDRYLLTELARKFFNVD